MSSVPEGMCEHCLHLIQTWLDGDIEHQRFVCCNCGQENTISFKKSNGAIWTAKKHGPFYPYSAMYTQKGPDTYDTRTTATGEKEGS